MILNSRELQLMRTSLESKATECWASMRNSAVGGFEAEKYEAISKEYTLLAMRVNEFDKMCTNSKEIQQFLKEQN